jgi:hypothetical protein
MDNNRRIKKVRKFSNKGAFYEKESNCIGITAGIERHYLTGTKFRGDGRGIDIDHAK